MDSLYRQIRRPKIYLAAPLFNDSERAFNRELKVCLEYYFDVFLPQEDGGLIIDMVNQGMSVEQASRKVFDMDIVALDDSDMLIIVLDGRTVDEGAAFELGYAYARGKLCFGLQTDQRRLLKIGNNPMIDNACKHVFNSKEALVTWAKRYTSANSHPLINR